MMQTLKINGTEKHFEDDQLPETVIALLDYLRVNYATVVAEINGKVIERKDFEDTRLTPGDSIELVRFVGGG